ncbi:MAG: tetratricopeptide repeat protein, partial [Rhodospirillales bacterium]|nr:tetratricopeptide repeat protein [Rhodospirillales bacterium]
MHNKSAETQSAGTQHILDLLTRAQEFQKSGRLPEAETIFRSVLKIDTKNLSALHSLGILAHQTGNDDAAAKMIEKVLDQEPQNHQARSNLGNVYLSSGRIEDAIDQYRQSIALNPGYEKAVFNLATAYEQSQNYRSGEEVLKEFLASNSRNAQAHFKLGLLQDRLGDRTNAQISFRIALEIDPRHARARKSLGSVMASLGCLDEAVVEFKIALKDAPEDHELINLLGVAFRKNGQFNEAINALETSVRLSPKTATYHSSLGAAYHSLGDIKAARKCYNRSLELDPDSENSEMCLLFLKLIEPSISSEAVFEFHRKLRARHDRPELIGKIFPAISKEPDRKLRVGYLSSDFRTHVVSLNILPLLANRDQTKFETYLYAEVPHPDGMTELFQSHSEHYRSIVGQTNAQVAETIEADGIDILVILAGRFDENRPLVASYRAAPIQISFHDCATSGLIDTDYYLTDDILHPEDTPELFTEELVRLPIYYQYPLPDGLPDIPPLPCLKNGYVTFGSFNKPEKINDTVVDLWAKLLTAVPDSRLFLKYFNLYSDESLAHQWTERFELRGISPERLIIRAQFEKRPLHLERVGEIDIALDPYPFNGATTT